MAKFIKAEDIPADMNAVAFWETSHGETMWQMSKSVRGAKMIRARHTDSPSHGWATIETSDRINGMMIW